MEHCPHCGTRLPDVVDAFCPECRGDLDETPQDRGVGIGARGEPDVRRPDYVPVVLIVGGVFLLVSSLLTFTRPTWVEALYRFLGGLLAIGIGIRLATRSRR